MAERNIQELFYQTDPEDISDAEMDNVIIPYLREQRKRMLEAEATGKPAPRTKRIDAPADLSLDMLKL